MVKGGAGIADESVVRRVAPHRVARVRAALAPEPDVTELADVFALLGDPGRLRLLAALLEGRRDVLLVDHHQFLDRSARRGAH